MDAELADSLGAFVISLERLPSHGRVFAERRHIPIVFAGGAEEKVAVARREFPQATFCTPEGLTETVRRLVNASV